MAEDQPPVGFFKFLHSLNLDPEQQQLLKQSFPAHRQQIKALRQQLNQQRQQLYELINQPQPNEAEITAPKSRRSTTPERPGAGDSPLSPGTSNVISGRTSKSCCCRDFGQRLCGSGFCCPKNLEHRRGRGRCGPRLARRSRRTLIVLTMGIQRKRNRHASPQNSGDCFKQVGNLHKSKNPKEI